MTTPVAPPASCCRLINDLLRIGLGAGIDNGSQWRYYDWSKITALAPFARPGAGAEPDAEMYCAAHRKGVRVLSWTDCGPTLCCPVSELYKWLISKDRTKLNSTKSADGLFTLNRTLITSWARTTATCIAKAGLDGVLLDMEDVGGHQWQGVDSMSAISFGVCQLRAFLNETIPGSLIVWTTEDSRLADYKAIAEAGCVDFYLEMEYGKGCHAVETHGAGDGNGHGCRANAPIAAVNDSIRCYTDTAPGIGGCDGNGFGVSPNHAGLLLSWGGCDYECIPNTGNGYNNCGAVRSWKRGDARPSYFPWPAGGPSHGGRPGGQGADAFPWCESPRRLPPRSLSFLFVHDCISDRVSFELIRYFLVTMCSWRNHDLLAAKHDGRQRCGLQQNCAEQVLQLGGSRR